MIRTIAANLEQVAELSDSRLNKDRMLGAAVGVALATAYLFSTLLGLGEDFRSTQHRRHSDAAIARHGTICERLLPNAATGERDACIEELDWLQGWHRKLFLETYESLLRGLFFEPRRHFRHPLRRNETLAHL